MLATSKINTTRQPISQPPVNETYLQTLLVPKRPRGVLPVEMQEPDQQTADKEKAAHKNKIDSLRQQAPNLIIPVLPMDRGRIADTLPVEALSVFALAAALRSEKTIICVMDQATAPGLDPKEIAAAARSLTNQYNQVASHLRLTDRVEAVLESELSLRALAQRSNTVVMAQNNRQMNNLTEGLEQGLSDICLVDGSAMAPRGMAASANIGAMATDDKSRIPLLQRQTHEQIMGNLGSIDIPVGYISRNVDAATNAKNHALETIVGDAGKLSKVALRIIRPAHDVPTDDMMAILAAQKMATPISREAEDALMKQHIEHANPWG